MTVRPASMSSAAEVTALARPTAAAEGLGPSYYSAAAFEEEQRSVFPSNWIGVGFGSDIPHAGDMRPVTVAGFPILLVRDRDGSVRAFHNICRHRGMQLVEQPCNARLVRCPWHSWSYRLDGRLAATPDLGGAGITQLPEFDRAELGLVPIAVGVWSDLIFVNLDGNAAPLQDVMAPLGELLDHVGVGDIACIGRGDQRFKANWKLCVEGGIEDYHLPFGHPQLGITPALRNSRVLLHDGVYYGVITELQGNEAEDSAAAPWAASLPPFVDRNGKPFTSMYSIGIFPNAGILVAFDHVALTLLLPLNDSSTDMRYAVYTRPDTASSPQFEQARQENMTVWAQVVSQDAPFCEGAQATLAARERIGMSTRFSPYWEISVHGFQKAIAAALAPQD